MLLDFITWTADPAIFTIGSREIRWYGLAFALGFAIGYKIVERMWKKEQLPPEWIDSLLIYTMLGTVIGARLGHCLFYAPDYYPDKVQLSTSSISASLALISSSFALATASM